MGRTFQESQQETCSNLKSYRRGCQNSILWSKRIPNLVAFPPTYNILYHSLVNKIYTPSPPPSKILPPPPPPLENYNTNVIDLCISAKHEKKWVSCQIVVRKIWLDPIFFEKKCLLKKKKKCPSLLVLPLPSLIACISLFLLFLCCMRFCLNVYIVSHFDIVFFPNGEFYNKERLPCIYFIFYTLDIWYT